MGETLGIDLGTTYSVVAHVDEHGRPTVIPNAHGKRITPSAVCFRDDEILVGEEAKEILALGIAPGMMFFKRAMGDADFSIETPLGDYDAIMLASCVLKDLKKSADNYLHKDIKDVVITVPAYFRDPERKATIEAGRLAGLNVLKIINEPTAAAIAFGFENRGDQRTLLVYDLGGGTFDVTLLRYENESVHVIGSDGSHELGGKDWDDRITSLLTSEFESEFGCRPDEDPESFADLQSQAEKAKCSLSDRETVTVTFVHSGHRGRYDIVRERFEDLTADLIQRTTALMERLLGETKLLTSDVDEVVLVGGSTRMPMVQRAVEEFFGKKPISGIDADHAVALGAALAAHAHRSEAQSDGSLSIISYSDVSSHSLGMIALNESRSAYVNSIILPKNKRLPCDDVRPFTHRRGADGEEDLEIYMTQGESEAPEDVAYLGKYKVLGIPFDSKNSAILDIAYRYDVNGTVDVTCRSRSDNKALDVQVESLPDDVPSRFLMPPQMNLCIPHTTVYLAFDLSGSMSGINLEEAQKAALGFLENLDLAHSSLGIIGFSDRVQVKLGASKSAKKIEAAIRELKCAETGFGNATDPFREIAEALEGVDGRRFSIILADGVWAYQGLAIERAKLCSEKGIEVIAIGFGAADETFLKAIASSDESALFTSMSGLVPAFSAVAQVLTETAGEDSIEMNRSLGIRLGADRS